MIFLQIDSLEHFQKFADILKDTITVFTVDTTKPNSTNSLLTNTGFFTVLGAILATFTALSVLLLKEYFDNSKNKKQKKENIFIEFSSNCYRILIAMTKADLFSSEQEFYLAMTNASQIKETRDIYQFMYKDNAEKYAMAFKDITQSVSDFNKVIASYVLLTRDTEIADEINVILARIADNLDYRYDTKNPEELQEFRLQNDVKIEFKHLEMNRKFGEYRQRVYEKLGYKL